ncbi:unnamed protein product [Gulo gulo]|uniref:Uncharacterized protein n=1 Tax=Gulo gulo TaxID=48420 RepID=A0A9X9LCU3_GULGU|nr:unnamed protein product [Gulo gulo]
MSQCWAPWGGAPPEADVGWEQGPGSEHPADGQQSGRLPGEGFFLTVSSLGGPGLCSVCAKAQGEAGMQVRFSPLTPAPSEELEPAPASATQEGGIVPGETSTGDQEAADDLVPAQKELVPSPVPAPAPATPPSPAPAPDRAVPTSPAPTVLLFLPLIQLLPLIQHWPSPLHLIQLLPLLRSLPTPLSLPLLLPGPLPFPLPQAQLLTLLLTLPLPGPCPCLCPRLSPYLCFCPFPCPCSCPRHNSCLLLLPWPVLLFLPLVQILPWFLHLPPLLTLSLPLFLPLSLLLHLSLLLSLPHPNPCCYSCSCRTPRATSRAHNPVERAPCTITFSSITQP